MEVGSANSYTVEETTETFTCRGRYELALCRARNVSCRQDEGRYGEEVDG